MTDIRFRVGGRSRDSEDYYDNAQSRDSRDTEDYGSHGRDSGPAREYGHDTSIRRDYAEKFGRAARERKRVSEYRRWEMGQLLYGPSGKASRTKKSPQIMHSKQFEIVMKHISELYDIEYDAIKENLPESKKVVSVHAKGCFVCRLCHHTWASEMAWVDIDLWEQCICCYYQQKCMHCCEKEDSAAIPMFADAQQRRLICRSFLRAGLIRMSTLSLKVFLAGPQKPKSNVSKPHLGLLCGKCGYSNCELPPCSAAEGKEKSDKKLAALYDEMRDSASTEPKPNESGELITFKNAGAPGGCSHSKFESKLRRPNFGLAGGKRAHFKMDSAASSRSGGKMRVSVFERLGPLKAQPDEDGDGPARKRPRHPISADGLSETPDKDEYVSAVPDVKPSQHGRRKKSLLLSHLERAAAKSRRMNILAEEEIQENSAAAASSNQQIVYIKQEKPWQQFNDGTGDYDTPAPEKLTSRTEEEYMQQVLCVEDADGDVEYMYTVNHEGDLLSEAAGDSSAAQTEGASSTNGAEQPAAQSDENLVVGPDGQPMRVKEERVDPAYFVHMAGDKPVRIKEELPWMQTGDKPFKDILPPLADSNDGEEDGEEENGGMFLVEDAEGEVEYLFTKYPAPDKLVLDNVDDDSDGRDEDDAGAENGIVAGRMQEHVESVGGQSQSALAAEGRSSRPDPSLVTIKREPGWTDEEDMDIAGDLLDYD